MLMIALLMMLPQAPAAPAKPAAPPPPAVAAPPAPAAVNPPAPPAPPAAPLLPASELLEIKTVYLLPMGNAFDQYLANHLTRGGMYQVVTDPSRADAVFTDRLGKAFELKMEELYPKPKLEPEPAKPHDEDEPEKQSMDMKSAPMDRTSSFGRGKGTYFLVHRGSRNVVWSIYEKPKNVQPGTLDDTAKYVARRLESSARDSNKAAHKK
jgi:hypothetical protein